MNNSRILGVRKFTSKAGKPLCIVGVSTPFTDREIEHGAFGCKVEELWIPESCHELFTPNVVGKLIDVSYNVSGGKAYINDVKIK